MSDNIKGRNEFIVGQLSRLIRSADECEQAIRDIDYYIANYKGSESLECIVAERREWSKLLTAVQSMKGQLLRQIRDEATNDH